MYYRIMNQLDKEIFAENHPKLNLQVLERLEEITQTLDSSYGSLRSSHSLGGFVLFFNSSHSYNNTFSKIVDYYHLDKDESEYSEVIAEDKEQNQEWWEELYLLSSDDALVFIHPKDRLSCEKE